MRVWSVIFLSLAAMPLRADPPSVITDIAPVHSLVARVMDGVGAPDLLIPPDASPHGYAMRPSEARALSAADLVVWVGPALTPWLETRLETLAPAAERLELLSAPGTMRLPFREGPVFETVADAEDGNAGGETHEHDEDHGTEVAHSDTNDGEDGHDSADEHQGHAHEDDHDAADDHGHAHAGDVDPHAWLDPRNAAAWLDAIAGALARLDPENAAAYRANAAEGASELHALEAELAETLAPLRARGFLVYHDAFQYFERRFGLAARGALLTSDAVPAGAGRVQALTRAVAAGGPVCAFSEPQFSPDALDALALNGAMTVAVLDPVGRDIAAGPGQYAALLRGLGRGMAGCLAQGGQD
jgi:zinc transport system substrate-binding protein